MLTVASQELLFGLFLALFTTQIVNIAVGATVLSISADFPNLYSVISFFY